MIKFFKLVTGEDALAEIVEENELHYVLKNPMRFVPTQEGIGIAPLAMFVKNGATITINKDKVIFAAEPEDEIANVYNAKFGSGIVMPPSGIQLP
jgi:hypothetical protein